MSWSRFVVIAGAVSTTACGLLVSVDGLSNGGSDIDGADATTDPRALPEDAAVSDARADGDADATSDAAPENAYKAAVLADQPLAYWPLDEAAGLTAATDVIGHRLAIASGAAMTFGVPGVAGTALSIDDDDVRLAVGDVFDFAGDVPFSIEAWATPSLEAEYENVIQKRTSGPVGWVLYFRKSSDVQFEQSWDGGNRSTFSTDGRSSSGPAHLVATFDGTSVSLYIDGLKVTKAYQSGSGSPDTAASLVFGGGYVGVLDEIAIYDHALPPERVLAHRRAAGYP